tara:strand:- start:479 stop:862 length:384 start_codon:yes stop_codon:yes gene_type:complete
MAIYENDEFLDSKLFKIFGSAQDTDVVNRITDDRDTRDYNQGLYTAQNEAVAGVETTGGIPSPEHQKRIDAKKAKVASDAKSKYENENSNNRNIVLMKSGGTSMGSGKSSTSSGIKMCGSQIGKHMK